jgi:hypothetical protein
MKPAALCNKIVWGSLHRRSACGSRDKHIASERSPTLHPLFVRSQCSPRQSRSMGGKRRMAAIEQSPPLPPADAFVRSLALSAATAGVKPKRSPTWASGSEAWRVVGAGAAASGCSPHLGTTPRLATAHHQLRHRTRRGTQHSISKPQLRQGSAHGVDGSVNHVPPPPPPLCRQASPVQASLLPSPCLSLHQPRHADRSGAVPAVAITRRAGIMAGLLPPRQLQPRSRRAKRANEQRLCPSRPSCILPDPARRRPASERTKALYQGVGDDEQCVRTNKVGSHWEDFVRSANPVPPSP